jgi:transposase
MNNGNGLSRGDRNRNARLEKLRAAVPVTNAIGARRTFRCKAWDLGAALEWGCRAQHPGRLFRGHGGV